MNIKLFQSSESIKNTIIDYANYRWNFPYVYLLAILCLSLPFLYLKLESILSSQGTFSDKLFDILFSIIIVFLLYSSIKKMVNFFKEKKEYIKTNNSFSEYNITFTSEYIHIKTKEKEINNKWEDFKQFLFYKNYLFLSLKKEKKNFEYLIDLSSLEEGSIQKIKNRLNTL